MQDPIFIDFFNKFMCVPIFPIKCICRDGKFDLYPELDEMSACYDAETVQESAFNWVLEERLPFFFESPVYVEYQLCRLLTSAMTTDSENSDLVDIQKRYLSSMSAMYKFKRWLKNFSYVGILSLTFWMDAQAALVVHYKGKNDQDDAQVMLLELKDKYYEKHSQFCLPDPILMHGVSKLCKTSPEYTITVQAKVLRHLQYYYMPEFLLAHKHELIDTQADSKTERDLAFFQTLKTFVNRSFQNCNLVYSINSATELLGARRPTTGSNEAINEMRRISSTTRSSLPRGDRVALFNETDTSQLSSVAVKPSDIMVYHMEYRGRLSIPQRTPTIEEQASDQSMADGGSRSSESDEPAREPRVSLILPDRRESVAQAPKIYQSRSLFTRGGKNTSNSGATLNTGTYYDQPKYIQERKLSPAGIGGPPRATGGLSMPYNQRKQSIVQRKTVSRRMTLRRGTMTRNIRLDSKTDARGQALSRLGLDPISDVKMDASPNSSNESLKSRPSHEDTLAEKKEMGFMKMVKTRMAVAKTVRKLKVKTMSRRARNAANVDRTVCVKFRMNENGESLGCKSVSSNTVAKGELPSAAEFEQAAQGNLPVERPPSNEQIVPHISHEGSGMMRQPTLKNPMVLFKLKGMAKRGREKTLGKRKPAPKPESPEAQSELRPSDLPIRQRRASMNRRRSIFGAEDEEKASNSGSNEGLTATPDRGRHSRMSIAICSTAANTNQRGAKCVKTNLKVPRLQAIATGDTQTFEDGSPESTPPNSNPNLLQPTGVNNNRDRACSKRLDFAGLEGASYVDLSQMNLKMPTSDKSKRGKKAGKNGERKSSGKGQKLMATRSIASKGSMHRKQSMHSVKSTQSDMHRKSKCKEVLGRHMLPRVELEKRFTRGYVKKIFMVDPDVPTVDENAIKNMAMNELIILQRRSYTKIQALLSDRLSGGVFHQYLTQSASFDMRSLLCLAYIQDLQMFEDCFPLLDRIQVNAAFEAILLKNVPTSLTILNELPGLRQHWNYLLKELSEDNNWQQIPWRLYAIKVDAIKLLLVEYARFTKQQRTCFLDAVNQANDTRTKTAGELTTTIQFSEVSKTQYNGHYNLAWREKQSDEGDSDLDSDEENARHEAGVEKMKQHAIKEQLLSSLPIGKRQRFQGKCYTDHHVFSQLVFFFGKDITLSCFSILSNDDQIPDVLLQQEKAFLNHKPLPTEQLALHSLVQYPNQNDAEQMGGYDAGVSARIVEKQKHKPMYMCSIRKNGHVLRRPDKRPANFIEVLREPRHYEFFARYLKAMNCDGPLMFWKSVEHLKTIPEAAKRQIKIKSILKKYFAWSANQTKTIVRLAATINLLNCNADIIRDIIDLDIESVNVSLLVAAQTAVQRAMEKNWETRYYKTFPDSDQNDEPTHRHTRRLQDSAAGGYTASVEDEINRNPQSSNAWRALYRFIKRSSMFIRAMKSPTLKAEFREYLKEYAVKRRSIEQQQLLANSKMERYALSVDHREKEMAYEIPSRASSVCKIYPYHLYDPDDPNMNLMSMKFEMVCGKNVYPELLANDLDFWLEVQLYQEAIACWSKRQSVADGPVCNDHIKKKIHLISTVYLHSHIPPKVRVNADHELARTIQMYSLQLSNGGVTNANQGYTEIDRSIFHDIVLQIFPVLIKHWSAFCHSKFSYVSKQAIAKRRQVQAQIKHEQLFARRQREKVRALKKHNCVPDADVYPTPCTTAATRVSDLGGSGDSCDAAAMAEKFKNLKVENSVMVDAPILKFSVSGGGPTWMRPQDKNCANSYISVRSRESSGPIINAESMPRRPCAFRKNTAIGRKQSKLT